ncbi:MAG: dienelactone hydrolase family protein [Rhizobiaceae bacterium]
MGKRSVGQLVAAVLSLVWFCLLTIHTFAFTTFERVTIQNPQDKTSLTAFYAAPKREGPFPAVVLLHGCCGLGFGGGVRAHYSSWAEHLNRTGFAVLLIDSMGSRGFATTCGMRTARRVMYRYRPADAYAGLRYLQSIEEIAGDRVGLIGWSQGGGVALLTIVSKSIGRPAPPPEHDFKSAIAFYPAVCSDALQSMPFTDVEPGTWSPIAPLLVLHGAMDNWTRVGSCKRFANSAAARGEPVSMKIYPHAVHAFDAPNLKLQRRKGPVLGNGERPLIGTDYKARRDALKTVVETLIRDLGR